jgi:hypothetical protein
MPIGAYSPALRASFPHCSRVPRNLSSPVLCRNSIVVDLTCGDFDQGGVGLFLLFQGPHSGGADRPWGRVGRLGLRRCRKPCLHRLICMSLGIGPALRRIESSLCLGGLRHSSVSYVTLSLPSFVVHGQAAFRELMSSRSSAMCISLKLFICIVSSLCSSLFISTGENPTRAIN